MPVRSLGYIDWSTPKFDEWRSFAAESLGLMPRASDDADVEYFRWDERPFRLVVRKSSEVGIGAIGLEVADDQELEEVLSRLDAAGVKSTVADTATARQRSVSGLASCEDPDGIRIELFYGPILTHERLVAPLMSGFVTGAQGMGHVVLSVADIDESAAFYRRALGMSLRNTMQFPRPDGGAFRMQFMGCNARHHTVGLIDYPIPGHLLHFMVEAATVDDVGYALDRCMDNGFSIVQGLGRHTNDHMLSFYCVGPDGAQVEVGWGGLPVDPATETTYEITKTSFWGHRPLKV